MTTEEKLAAAEARALAAETTLENARKHWDIVTERTIGLSPMAKILQSVDITAARELMAKAAERDALAAHCERLEEFVDEIKGLADISDGIAGFHQNGELLNWQQVDCMVDVDDLLALTPAASLAAYREGVLEEVALEMTNQGCTPFVANLIRAMKEAK